RTLPPRLGRRLRQSLRGRVLRFSLGRSLQARAHHQKLLPIRFFPSVSFGTLAAQERKPMQPRFGSCSGRVRKFGCSTKSKVKAKCLATTPTSFALVDTKKRCVISRTIV